MINSNEKELARRVRELGITQWRALPPMRFDAWKPRRPARGMTADPEAVLPGATAMLALMAAYRPWRDWPESSLWVHPHYPAYHRMRQASRELIEWIKAQGWSAADAHKLPQRHVAFAAGFGTAGVNGMIIHSKYGSRICFYTILTDMPLPLSPPVTGEMLRCDACGACETGCPAGALRGCSRVDAQRCLRSYAPMRREIPEPVRLMLGARLMGCDECQSVCPINRNLTPVDPPEELLRATRLAGLLDWGSDAWREQLKLLGGLIGANEARAVRTTAAAAMHAGNTGDPRLLPALEKLEAHPDERVRDMAAWAARRIRESDAWVRGNDNRAN